MEDERYDEMMWERLEDEGRWVGWQGTYSDYDDPYFDRLNRLNARSQEGRRQLHDATGDHLDFESFNRGPYTGVSRVPLRRKRRAYHRLIEESRNGPYTGVGPRAYRRPDARIWEEVCERLARHGRIDAREIEVAVQDGEVTLQGAVPARSMKRLSEDAAAAVPGVREVHNRLRLSGVRPVVL